MSEAMPLVAALCCLVGLSACDRQAETNLEIHPARPDASAPEVTEVSPSSVPAPPEPAPVPPRPEISPVIDVASSLLMLAHDRSEPLPSWRCTQAQWSAARDPQRTEQNRRDNARDAAIEWRHSRLLRTRVGGDLSHYRQLRWLYLRRGICDGPDFVTHGIREVQFLGRPVWVNARIAPKLALVNRRLKASMRRPPHFVSIGSFATRTLRGPYGKLPWLSNHALGLAVDIDPKNNPYLTAEDIHAIEIVSGVTIHRWAEVPAGRRWDTFHDAEVAFREKLASWQATALERVAELEALARGGDLSCEGELDALRRVLHVLKTSRHVRAARHRPIMTVGRALVVEMERVGMSWATDFTTGSDLMHFEYRVLPPSPAWPTQLGGGH